MNENICGIRKVVSSLFLIVSSLLCYAIDGNIITTIDYSFTEKWNHTFKSTTPLINGCDSIYKNQNIFINVVANDCDLNNDDSLNVEYFLKIFKPDHSIYFFQDKIQFTNTTKSNKNGERLRNAIVKMHFKNSDPYGEYNIVLEIVDKLSHKSKFLDSKVTLVEIPSYKQLPEIKEIPVFTKWMDNYYKDPCPAKALSYYIFYTKSELSENETTFLPVISFFLEIVRNNSFLLTQILECFESQDLKARIYLIYLLRYSNIVSSDFFDQLEGLEKEIYLKVKDLPLADLDGAISDPYQLDMLWSTFFASGSYQPILKLIKTLEYSTYQVEFETTNKKEDDQEVMKNAIYNVLIWSLKNNCKNHDLVKAYCEWSMQFEELSNLQKIELSKILKD